MTSAADADSPMVRVWALAPPSAIVENEAIVEKGLRAALGATDRGRHRVTVAPGFIEHEDTKGLWNTRGAELPTAEQARSYAARVIVAVSRALSPSGDRALAEAVGPVLLVPPRLRPIDLFRVLDMEHGGWDHWLIRARPQLTLQIEDGASADVCGAQVDVRIGPGGAVLGYLSRWRPLLDEHVDVALSPPPQEEAEDRSGSAKPAIVYALDGESSPQHYLSPYYAIADGDDLTLASACELSLVVHVVRYSLSDPSSYVAVVDGGSGDYQFDWGMLPFADFSDGALVELGAGETFSDRSADRLSTLSVVQVAPGAHLMLVNVVDRQSGAFKHHSEQVYVAEPSDTGAPVA